MEEQQSTMDYLDAASMLRFLEEESKTLQQMQLKISNELHRLQVEEELFVRTIERLTEGAKKASNIEEVETGRDWEDSKGSRAGLELAEALQLELARLPLNKPASLEGLNGTIGVTTQDPQPEGSIEDITIREADGT